MVRKRSQAKQRSDAPGQRPTVRPYGKEIAENVRKGLPPLPTSPEVDYPLSMPSVPSAATSMSQQRKPPRLTVLREQHSPTLGPPQPIPRPLPQPPLVGDSETFSNATTYTPTDYDSPPISPLDPFAILPTASGSPPRRPEDFDPVNPPPKEHEIKVSDTQGLRSPSAKEYPEGSGGGGVDESDSLWRRGGELGGKITLEESREVAHLVRDSRSSFFASHSIPNGLAASNWQITQLQTMAHSTTYNISTTPISDPGLSRTPESTTNHGAGMGDLNESVGAMSRDTKE